MARPQRRLNDAPSEVIEENFLKENPEMFPDDSGIVIAKHIPKMRRVLFINGRDPGETLTFHYASKTHALKHYTLFHGKEEDLPQEVIDHLEDLGEITYAYRRSYDGHPEMYPKGKKYLFQFKNVKAA